MNIHDLEKALNVCGQPSFRLKQAHKAVYERLICDWDEATDLPITMRTYLKENVPLSSLEKIGEGKSSRGDTKKVVFKLTQDEAVIESVLMKHDHNRNTVCVSSQVGCPMACNFCATGKNGFIRNLTAEEIVDQVMYFARELNKKEARVSNVVFMGMGEPFHNYDQVIKAVRELNSEDGLNIAARKISISTCGILSGIRKLAHEPLQVNLAISLHAPTNDVRDSIMPVNSAYPIEKLISEIDKYITATNRKVMLEYLLIEGVNDSLEMADDLADLLHGKNLYHVNLIRFHRTGKYRPSPRTQRDAFMQRLQERNISVSHRVSFGEDIDAACGMLAGKNNK